MTKISLCDKGNYAIGFMIMSLTLKRSGKLDIKNGKVRNIKLCLGKPQILKYFSEDNVI